MSIDPKGMQPGITPETPPQKVVDVKCRVQGCDSTRAIEISLSQTSSGKDGGAPSNRMYQCTKCHSTWGLPVGGAFLY